MGKSIVGEAVVANLLRHLVRRAGFVDDFSVETNNLSSKPALTKVIISPLAPSPLTLCTKLI